MNVFRLLPVLLAAASLTAAPGFAGSRRTVVPVLPAVVLPLSAGMRELHRESVVMNGVPTSLRIFTCGEGRAGYRARLRDRGWRRTGGRRTDRETPLGCLAFTAWEKNGRVLLVGHPSAGEGWVALALFAGKPAASVRRGDAPGRDPAGFPRPPSSTRLFHLAGGTWESAGYRSPANPGGLLAEAVRKLDAAGWRHQGAGEDALAASSPDGVRVVLLVVADGSGCVFILMTGRLANI